MRHARAVVGDVDLDLVADPPDADAHALGRRRVLRLVLEQLLEDLAEARLVADRDHAASRGRSQRIGRGRSSSRSVSTVSSTAATASNGARDSPVRPSPRTDARIESTRRSSRAELVRRGRAATRRGRRSRRRPGVAGRRLGQQVDVDAHDRQRRPQLVGHDAQQLGPGRRRARSARPAAPRPRRSAGPSRRSRPAAPRSSRGTRSRPARTGAVSRVWTLRTPTTSSCHTSGTDSIPASASMSKPRTHAKRSSTVTSSTAIGARDCGHPAGDALAPGRG